MSCAAYFATRARPKPHSDGPSWLTLIAQAKDSSGLNLVNQGDALFGTVSINWFKIVLTSCVPYAVSTYGAVSVQMRQVASTGAVESVDIPRG
jgi:hypothetical protein